MRSCYFFVYSIFIILLFVLCHHPTNASSNEINKQQQQQTTQSSNVPPQSSSSSTSSLSINDIINKGYDEWKRSKNELPTSKLSESKSSNNKYVDSDAHLESSSLHGYHCVHDTVTRDIDSKIKAGLEHLQDGDLPPPPQPPKSFLKASKMVAEEGFIQESTNAQSRQPIRIVFESIIESDSYKCTSIGQKVPSGLATATVSCSTASANDESCLYTCSSNDLVTNQVIENINVVMASMKELFANLLMVDQQDPLKLDSYVWSQLNQECDYGVPINESLISPGITGADIIVYVTARPTVSTSTIAYARACNFNVFRVGKSTIYGRPLAATINFNPIYFNQNPSKLIFKEYVRVGIHEMTHALGFSNMFYSSYKNHIGQYQNPLIALTQSGRTPNGNSYEMDRYALNTSSVYTFAQDHYGCPQPWGVQLEDSGGLGTSYSHWEKRQVGEEYMLGYVAPIMPITGLTLSLLQDTGWYDVSKDKAEPLLFGSKMGCDFMTQCTPSTWNYQGYFCTESGQKGCTSTRMGKGLCTIYEYQSVLPFAYQHFADSRKGGEYSGDACPLYQVPDTNILGIQYCVDDSQTGNSDVYEVFSDSSRCFEYNDDGYVKQACWQFKCQGTQVSVNINGDWNICPDGGNITVNGVNVLCPHGFAECGGTPTKIDISSLQSLSSRLLPFNSLTIIILLIFLLSWIKIN